MREKVSDTDITRILRDTYLLGLDDLWFKHPVTYHNQYR